MSILRIAMMLVLVLSSTAYGDSYVPTTLKNMRSARKVFKGLNAGFSPQSESGDRAHVWSYEMNSKSGIKSNKVFLFFSTAYVNEHQLREWFHVSPSIPVKGKAQEIIFDRMHAKAPMKLEDWKNQFVVSHKSCKLIQQFSEYDRLQSQSSEDCYLMIVPMYYYSNSDLLKRDTYGEVLNEFSRDSVDRAYESAFPRP